MKSFSQTCKVSIAVALTFCLLTFKSSAQITRFTLLVNEVNTNFNYGKSNSTLRAYKKDVVGIQAGASFQAGITQKFSIVTEAYYAMKGAILKTNNLITTNESKLRLYGAEIPVLARLQFGRVYINSGPYVSYTFSGRIKTEASPSIPEKSTTLLFGSAATDFKRWELGVQAGAGYAFHLLKKQLVLDIRYGYGLTNISRDIERYNRSLSISIVAFKPWKKNPFEHKR